MEQKVTIYTLAEKLNMSVSAVSRAFNPNSKLSAEKRKIILEAAEQYGYVQNKMASRLSQQPIRIGVLMRGRTGSRPLTPISRTTKSPATSGRSAATISAPTTPAQSWRSSGLRAMTA